MELTAQKRMAAQVTKRSPKKITFDTTRLDEIKEAITKSDIRGLVKDGAIIANQVKGSSRGRARKLHTQKIKGKRRGEGSRKGKANARMDIRRQWINRIRLQRRLLNQLKDKQRIAMSDYRSVYSKCKGGFFRNIRHLKLYLEERKLIKK